MFWTRCHQILKCLLIPVLKYRSKLNVILFTNDKRSSVKCYTARMAKFLTGPYFIVQRFECYTTLIVKELLYNKRLKFFTFFSKSFITYITITVTNISNSIIKQYYGIIKLFKVLVIAKKKQFSRTNILI